MSQFASKRNRKKRNYRAKGKGLSKRQKQQITSMIEDPVEKKFYDEQWNATPISLTPTIYDITAMDNGTLPSEVIGNLFDIQSIQYRFSFTKADTTNYIRYLIFQWFPDANTDGPNWNQIMQFETASLPADLTDIMSPYRLGEATSGLFKILVDEQFYLDSDNPIQLVKGFINKGFRKRASTNYTGATLKGANHIYVMLVSDSGAISHPDISGYTRLRYTDA